MNIVSCCVLSLTFQAFTLWLIQFSRVVFSFLSPQFRRCIYLKFTSTLVSLRLPILVCLHCSIWILLKSIFGGETLNLSTRRASKQVPKRGLSLVMHSLSLTFLQFFVPFGAFTHTGQELIAPGKETQNFGHFLPRCSLGGGKWESDRFLSSLFEFSSLSWTFASFFLTNWPVSQSRGTSPRIFSSFTLFFYDFVAATELNLWRVFSLPLVSETKHLQRKRENSNPKLWRKGRILDLGRKRESIGNEIPSAITTTLFLFLSTDERMKVRDCLNVEINGKKIENSNCDESSLFFYTMRSSAERIGFWFRIDCSLRESVKIDNFFGHDIVQLFLFS